MKNVLKKQGLGKRSLLLGVSLVLVLSLFLSACGSETSSGSADVIKIGALFDKTGPTADVGKPYAEGAKAYFEYINGKGGINGKQVELIDIDYGYKVPQALEAYKKLTQQDKVVGILGWGTGDTEAMKELIAEDHIPYISASYSENLTDVEAHPYNFLAAATYSDQARTAIKWIKDNWTGSGNPKLALVYNDTPFGKSPIEDAKAFAAKVGVDVVDEQVVDLSSLDASSQMLNMKEKAPDFAIIQQTWGATATIIKDAKRLGLETKFIGLNWASGEGLLPLAGDAAEGFIGIVQHAFPFEGTEAVPGLKEVEEYLKGNNKTLADVDQKFVQGWTSAKTMLEGAKLAGDTVTGETLKAGLEKLNNYETGGLGAPLTFSADSHTGTNQVRLAEVKNGEYVIITDYIGY
jgi:branched-chain amino acid transport system substrate-binding protein